jgi:hypothetical protein
MRPRPIFDTLLTALALLIVWTLIRDGETLTDEKLAKVLPDQPLKSVIMLLGPPVRPEIRRFALWSDTESKTYKYLRDIEIEFLPLDDWSPLITIRNTKTDQNLDWMIRSSGGFQSHFWFGKRRALWILTTKAGTIKAVAELDLERQGGGLWGWLTKHWKKWLP